VLAYFKERKQMRHQRRVRSAVVVLLSEHVFAQLSAEQQARVDLAVIAEYRKYWMFAWWMRRSDNPPDTVAVDRAYAMQRMAIPTGVVSLSWSDVLPPRTNYREFMYQDIGVNDFVRFDPATDEAISYLRSLGVALSEEQTHAFQWLEAQKARYP